MTYLSKPNQCEVCGLPTETRSKLCNVHRKERQNASRSASRKLLRVARRAPLGCRWCGGEFVAHPNAKYCSEICRDLALASYQADYKKRHYAEHREQIQNRQRKFNDANRDDVNARARELYWQRYRARSFAKRYDVTEEEMAKVLAIKSCEICGSEDRLVVDHDHISGEIRGRLCNRCNLVLGLCKDDETTLANMAAYLEAS